MNLLRRDDTVFKNKPYLSSSFKIFAIMLTRVFLSLFSICFALSGFSQTMRYNSLLWEITGNGLKKPSYLYGTMHVSNKVAFHLSDSFFVALKSVDVVALESSPENWMKELYGKPENQVEVLFRQPQPGSSFYTTCFNLNIPGNRELQKLLKYYPNIINNLLYRKKDGQDNFEENTYLDLFILQSGKKYGKQIASLEDPEYSEKLVELAKESIDENEEDKISYSRRNKILKGASYSDIIEDAYRRADLDYMDSISRILYSSKNYHKYMLEIRNELMVRSMDSIMKTGSIFAGVGAAHLPGQKGMINYLVKKGYRVRAVTLNKDVDSKQKEEVEKIHYPVTFTSFTDPDSVFTVEVPGQMYEMAKTKSYKYYLYPDVVNGCFYLVMTVQNYSALLGTKPKDYSEKLDSLLFENIPGKILKKSPFTTANGFSGYDIENVTKRGDHQAYKIIFTPNQLIVVKVIGNGDYARGEEATKFLNSIKLHTPNSKTFRTHYFPECGVKLYMPAKVHRQSAQHFNYRSYTSFLANALDANNHQYVFMQSALHDFKALEEDTFELNMLAENFCKEQDIKLKTSRLFSKELYPAIQFTGTYKNAEVYGRIVAAQPYYYLLLTSAKDKESEKFFNSLQLSAPVYTNTFARFVDSTLFFSVNTIDLADKDKKFLSHYEDKKKKSSKKEPEPKRYTFSRTHYYFSPASKECVEVNTIWFAKYSNVLIPDTFWAKRIRRYSNYGDLVVKSKSIRSLPDWQEAHVVFADTNTKEIISTRQILKGELFYVIKANSDSTRNAGKFVTEFMRSFEPIDTMIGKSIFISKADVFFSDLYSSDKSTQLGAKEALVEDYVDFMAGDDSILLRNIKRPEFNGLNSEEKKILINALSVVKNPQMHLELKKLYDSYADSTDIQMAIIETLAKEKTAAATKILLDILLNDTPQLENKEAAFDILYPFYDSLELAKLLFPQILELTRSSEYKYAIHKLMAYGVYKKVFTKELFADYKPFLFKECKSELRREFSSEKESSDRSYLKTRLVNTSESPAEKQIFSGANQNSLGNAHLYALYMLVELFREDPTSIQLMSKVQNLAPGNTKSLILSYLLSRNVSFPDSVLKPMAADPYARINWYSNLKKYKLTNYFDTKYATQKDFAYALAFGNMKLNPAEDTVKFIEKRLIGFKNHRGYAYFYKLKRKESSNYSIYAVGLFPQNEKELILEDMLGVDNKKIVKGDTEKELIDEMVQRIRIKDRPRTKTRNNYDY